MNEKQLASMQGVLQNILSPDNNLRVQSERVIALHLAKSSELFMFGLVKLLRTSTLPQVRTLCAVLLRQELIKGDPVLFETLSKPLQDSICKELLEAITTEPLKAVRKSVSETVAAIATLLLCKAGWPALYPFLYKCCSSPEPLQLTALFLFGQLADKCHEYTHKHLDGVHAVYSKFYLAPSLKLRMATLQSSARTIVHISDHPALYKKFQFFLPPMLKVLSDLLNTHPDGNDPHDWCIDVMTAFTELATFCSKFFRGHLEVFCKAMAAIGQSRVADNIRQLSLECLVSLAEGDPVAARKCPVFVQTAVSLSFHMMLTIPEDPDFLTQPENESLFDNTNFECGEMALDRLGMAIGAKKSVPVVFPLLGTFINNPDWKFRNAGLMALAQTGELFQFRQIPFRQLVAFLRDDHPRVRYAAAHCLGELSSDLQPQIQNTMHKLIFPALITSLADSQYPRLQRKNVEAIFYFVSNCEKEILQPYLNALMQAMLKLLHTAHQMVQEQVMATLAAISSADAEGFIGYYDQVVPLLKRIIVTANRKEVYSLRARAIEAISCIGLSIKDDAREKFKKDAKEVSQLFVKLMQNGEIADDDTSQQYMLQAWTRICSVLKEEFLPIIQMIMPAVLAAAGRQENWGKLQTTKTDNDCQAGGAMQYYTQAYTSALEAKSNAVSMLNSFSHDLKGHYLPYIPDTLKVVIPLVSFFHDEIRSFAISCLPDLMKAAVEACKMNRTDVAFVKGVFLQIAGGILGRLDKEPDTDLVMTLVGSLQMVVDETGDLAQCLDQNALHLVGSALLKLLTDSERRIAKRTENAKNPDLDEEARADIDAQNMGEDELNFMVSECIGSLIKTHKELFFPTLDRLLPQLVRMLAPTSMQGTRSIAIFIFDDLVEYIGPRMSRYFHHFVPALIKYLSDSANEIRQGSAYGLAVLGEHGGAGFAPYIDEAVKQLVTAIRLPAASTEPSLPATDNMVAALFRIAHFQSRPQLYAVAIAFLPIRSDADEARKVHKSLCQMVEANSPHALGANNSNLPKVISIFCFILREHTGTEMLDDELGSKIVAILKRMKQMPAPIMERVLASLPDRALVQQVFAKIQ